MGFNLKSCLPTLKIGHREQLTGGLGTGKALNSDEVVCLDVITSDGRTTVKVATGWVDGAVRVFDVDQQDMQNSAGLAHSLIEDNEDEDFAQQEPLLLNGHNQSPVRTVAFDKVNVSRLASGGSDGSVVVWDIVAETGLFRLLGHRGGITDISFLNLPGFDGLVSSSLDGLVKVWDLDGQCCTQTIANNHGEVWGAACMQIKSEEDETERWRLLTGGNDGQVRVWSVQPPKRNAIESDQPMNSDEAKLALESAQDDVCHFMGTLIPPPNVVTSSERISCIHYHPSGRHVGILQTNSKNVDVYLIRGTQESLKKRQRRLRRRQEKKNKKTTEKPESQSGQKRGILDDPISSDEEDAAESASGVALDPELIKASDEYEYLATIRASHKVKGFAFFPTKEKGEIGRIVCALSSNALETFSLIRKKEGYVSLLDLFTENMWDSLLIFLAHPHYRSLLNSNEKGADVVAEKIVTMDMHGHPTGIRAVALSSDDTLACTVSKNVTKVWNVASRSCIQSLTPSVLPSDKKGCYGLCTMFLPGNAHVLVGTREGHLLIIDIAAGEVVFSEEAAHDGAIWSLDVRRPTASESTITVVTGSADKTVKFWDVESQDEQEGTMQPSNPMVVQTRTLQMTDDVVAVRYSHSIDPYKRMVFVSTLDCTIKVFFDDSLKLFLSLYGHKLPALAVDSSDDDTIMASSGADKTVKIWGLDFGDTHRTLHGHQDSVTDLRFVKRTHNFFTASKDGSVRYWDADRFEQILLLNGHGAEINCLSISRTGAFVLSGAMDRQVRVWERTKDIVFLEEERERELEHSFDKMNNRNDGGTANILARKGGDEDDGDVNDTTEDEPQSEAAVKRSVLSVSAGDRIMEALERADQELKESASFRSRNTDGKERQPNPLLLNLEPVPYVLWVLRSIRSAELEQSLLVLPLSHLERLVYYIILLLKSGLGVELCSRVAIFMVKIHQNQVRTLVQCTFLFQQAVKITTLYLSEAY
jgi:U3 small nucleolar RNA-associated protein 12